MPDPTPDWLTTIKSRSRGILAAMGTTSVTVLAGIVLALMLRDYADDVGVPDLVREVRENYRQQNIENAMRRRALESSAGIRWNPDTETWEDLP